MKLSILFLVASAVVLGGCSSAYKTGQTPDDVYYSPARQQDEYVRVEKKDDRYYRGSDDYYEDRFLRMRIQDRNRWSALDDYYFYNTYAYNSYNRYNLWYSPWNSHWLWNTYYNPYCGGIPYYPGRVLKTYRNYTPPSRAVVFNPNSYISNSATSSRSAVSKGLKTGYNNTNINRNNNSLGDSFRKVFTGGNNNSGNNSTPSRSYSPSSSNSSSSGTGSRSSGGGGGGGVSRPSR